MSRELKFKVWDKVAKAMSDEFHLFGEFTLMGAVHDWQREVRLNFDPGDSLGMLNDLIELQWTGLLDKSGKEVYEGDILKYSDGTDQSHHRIYWDEKQGRWWDERLEDGDSSTGYDDFGFVTECRVIGNIYANPELLTTTP